MPSPRGAVNDRAVNLARRVAPGAPGRAGNKLSAMADVFRVRITVRGYELDTQGHLNQAVYLQYGEHARWECLRAAGISQAGLIAAGIGPVALEVTVRYLRELRGGDEVDVSCGFGWGTGKTFRIEQEYRRPDGDPVASLTGVGGLLDLHERRLVADPGERLRALAANPQPMGL
jgi:acyl-CoA thioester hydrolase